MPNQSKNQGIIPIFVLVAIGVAVLVGSTFVIREQFIKTGKSGKSALDEKKIQQQAQNPQPLPSLTPTPKGEATYNQPVTYKPTGQNEPGFSMKAPLGWEKTTPPDQETKLQFKNPDEDREDMEDGLFVKSQAQVSVVVGEAKGSTFDQLISAVKSASNNIYEKVTILSEQKITYAGEEAYFIETKLFKKGASMHSVDYYLLKNGYFVHTGGTALDSAWNMRSADIKGSLSSFILLD